jgi:hypothetical protein
VGCLLVGGVNKRPIPLFCLYTRAVRFESCCTNALTQIHAFNKNRTDSPFKEVEDLLEGGIGRLYLMGLSWGAMLAAKDTPRDA